MKKQMWKEVEELKKKLKAEYTNWSTEDEERIMKKITELLCGYGLVREGEKLGLNDLGFSLDEGCLKYGSFVDIKIGADENGRVRVEEIDVWVEDSAENYHWEDDEEEEELKARIEKVKKLWNEYNKDRLQTHLILYHPCMDCGEFGEVWVDMEDVSEILEEHNEEMDFQIEYTCDDCGAWNEQTQITLDELESTLETAIAEKGKA